MAHKDNIKASQRAEAEANPVVEEEIVAPVVVKTGHHTGVVQLTPKVEKPW